MGHHGVRVETRESPTVVLKTTVEPREDWVPTGYFEVSHGFARVQVSNLSVGTSTHLFRSNQNPPGALGGASSGSWYLPPRV